MPEMWWKKKRERCKERGQRAEDKEREKHVIREDLWRKYGKAGMVCAYKVETRGTDGRERGAVERT